MSLRELKVGDTFLYHGSHWRKATGQNFVVVHISFIEGSRRYRCRCLDPMWRSGHDAGGCVASPYGWNFEDTDTTDMTVFSQPVQWPPKESRPKRYKDSAPTILTM